MPEPCAAWKTSDGKVHSTEGEALRWERFSRIADRVQTELEIGYGFCPGGPTAFTTWTVANWSSLKAILNDPDFNDRT